MANYADGVPFDEAYDVLDEWNSSLRSPLTLQEFERTLKSAYSGKYQGVQRSYVESLLENWTDGSTSFLVLMGGISLPSLEKNGNAVIITNGKMIFYLFKRSYKR